MNKLSKYRQWIIAAIGILSLVISLGMSGQAFAAQNVADLSVTAVADKNRVKIGENITYTITATNLGPDTTSSFYVVLGLPDQLNFIDGSCGGASCLYLTLEPGESVVSTFVATPNPNDRNSDRNLLTVTASTSLATADTVDPNSGNNLLWVTVKLIGRLTHP